MRMVLLLVLCVLPAGAEDATEFFETKIRPLLASNCFACHGQSAMGGLRLDSREGAMEGGKGGAVIVAGKPDESVLMQAVKRTHKKLKMPPTAPLAEADVALLEAWIAKGAHYPESKVEAKATTGMVVTDEQRKFWSFQPLRKTAAPKVKNGAWVKTPVDAFVAAKLEEKALKPNGPADRATLLRRVTLDLTGLPPTVEETDAFVSDKSQEAFQKVVDRLLSSPHYGERWARHWLDLARYSDGLLAAGVDTPLPNSYRYRDWVVDAFNKDLPYDQFVKAQIAADMLPEKERGPLMAGLGFQAISTSANDQVDVTTKVFLGLTVGCAQCHDHKYDPIPTRDYYSLMGVFRSSKSDDFPLVSDAQVKAYEDQKKKVEAQKELIDEFLQSQQKLLIDTLARRTADYVVAAWETLQGKEPEAWRLDAETLKRWVVYLKDRDKEHPYMKELFAALSGKPTDAQVREAAEAYQRFVLQLFDDAKEVDDKNYVAFGGKKGMKDEKTRQYTNIVSLPVLQFYQWRELASGPYNIDGFKAPSGIYYYSTKEILRWLSGFAKDHYENLRTELKALEKGLPKQYPFLHTLKDGAKPADVKIAIRGDTKTLGEVAPRQFLTALAKEPKRFQKGSGRLELAESIVNHPLMARVMVNRMWQHHFGAGLVRTPSNFGQMGERPTHPELLDYLAQRLIDSGYSLKAVHREILLSNTYALASDPNLEGAGKVDPDNRLLWRGNVRPRLDMESLRDSVLLISGKLDPKVGGPAKAFTESNNRRSLYLTVSRTRLDATMSLFDFPDPNGTAEERPTTIGPLQGLFFLNSKFISEQSKALDERLTKECGTEPQARIERAYKLLYARKPEPQEVQLGIEYVAKGEKNWPRYLQVLLGSGEFTSLR